MPASLLAPRPLSLGNSIKRTRLRLFLWYFLRKQLENAFPIPPSHGNITWRQQHFKRMIQNSIGVISRPCARPTLQGVWLRPHGSSLRHTTSTPGHRIGYFHPSSRHPN